MTIDTDPIASALREQIATLRSDRVEIDRMIGLLTTSLSELEDRRKPSATPMPPGAVGGRGKPLELKVLEALIHYKGETTMRRIERRARSNSGAVIGALRRLEAAGYAVRSGEKHKRSWVCTITSEGRAWYQAQSGNDGDRMEEKVQEGLAKAFAPGVFEEEKKPKPKPKKKKINRRPYSETSAEVEAMLRRNPAGLTITQLREALGWSESKLKRLLPKMAEEKRIMAQRIPSKTVPTGYYLRLYSAPAQVRPGEAFDQTGR